ncbi:MAG: riboflavin synthase, partial [Xanthomonadales bacterium]|nr:riboflavin synthase [Xanthomonadales bacterium]
MFTGIVQALGCVHGVESRGGDMRLLVDAGGLDLRDVVLGDSIAVAGCCLTVVALDGNTFAADVSNETLTLTTLGSYKVGDR